MGFHHVALATAKMEATHHFYTEAMGFTIVKVVVNPTPEGGWAKHAFYNTNDGFGTDNALMAFWDLHGDAYPEIKPGLSRSVGLPDWVNHLAFAAVDASHMEVALKRWLDLGLDVVEIDHEFCKSIYTNDPNSTMVEWCLDTRPLSEQDHQHASKVILDPKPDFDEPPVGFKTYESDPSKHPSWMSL